MALKCVVGRALHHVTHFPTGSFPLGALGFLSRAGMIRTTPLFVSMSAAAFRAAKETMPGWPEAICSLRKSALGKAALSPLVGLP